MVRVLLGKDSEEKQTYHIPSQKRQTDRQTNGKDIEKERMP